MTLTLLGQPEPFISWAEVDAHLRLDGDEAERPLVETYMAAACAVLDGPESWTGRPIAPQTWSWSPAGLVPDCRGRVALPLRPVFELVSVKAGGEDLDGVVLGGAGGLGAAWLERAAGWPGGPAEIVFRAGYPDEGGSPEASGAPRPLKVAALMLVADLHRHRGEGSGQFELTPNPAIERLIAPYRVWRT